MLAASSLSDAKKLPVKDKLDHYASTGHQAVNDKIDRCASTGHQTVKDNLDRRVSIGPQACPVRNVALSGGIVSLPKPAPMRISKSNFQSAAQTGATIDVTVRF